MSGVSVAGGWKIIAPPASVSLWTRVFLRKQKEERLLGDLLLNLPVADVSKQHGSKEQTCHGEMEHKAFNILYVSVRLHHQTWAEDFPPDLRSEASRIYFSRWT
ncbi:hypothetical protein GOODEAATRI_026858, partial [Goodea atripinnis]